MFYSNSSNNDTTSTSRRLNSPSPHLTFLSSNQSNVFVHHHQINPLLSSSSVSATTATMEVPSSSHAMFWQDQIDHCYPSSTFLPCNRLPVPAVKKDRHSKISTAQGFRDRRVRLSIEIARKFFDLQDMLGFDKASRTLDWLLTKSEKAIKELSDNYGASTSTTCEVVSENGEEGLVSDGKKKKKMMMMKRLQKASSSNDLLVKESRAKARARARERTRVKMSTKKGLDVDNNALISNQYSRSLCQQHQSCEKLKVVGHDHGVSDQVLPKGNDIIEQSVMIKTKLKPSNSTTIRGYHQNLVMLRDVNCSNGNSNGNSFYLLNSPQNWDINREITHSAFCAIANMNPNAGFSSMEKLNLGGS